MIKKPPFDIYAEPVYDIHRIKKTLPHRPPFLLVDKILEISDNHIIGLKNVTMNEPFFTGHFPNEPIMPGVLQIEAMAQVGGIFVLHSIPDPENYSTYFLKINNVAAPIKRGICDMRGEVFVGNKMVMQGDLVAQIVKNNK